MSERIRNDHDWCQRLYQDKASGLILYGRALGLSHSESEDVLQDTFLAMMRKPDRPERPENYCIRSFRNRALNYRRSLWRRLLREIESVQWFEKSDRCDVTERAAMKCLARLPTAQREVIVLKIWHLYTFEEIGELLNTSHNTVAGRYRYGLEKLSTCLKEQDYERLESIGEPLALLEAPPSVGGP